MTSQATTDMYNDETLCDSESLWPSILATGSALFLGYFVGRVSYSNDLRRALRRIEESPELISVSIRTLW
jgi:hypothetical protein